MDELITSSGKIFKCDYLLASTNAKRIFFKISGESISTIASVFSDPAETNILQYGETFMMGYTKLASLVQLRDGIKVLLIGED